MKTQFAPEPTMSTAFVVVGEPVMFLLLLGVMLCSLLCVMAAMRKDGEALERTVPFLLCQLYLVLCGFFCLAGAAGSILSQVEGLLLLALGLAPTFLRRNNFRMARYSIALGAVLAALAMLL